MAWICRHPISNSTDPVDALTAVGLFRGDGESEFLLERPGKGAAHRVRLPAGGRADLVDGGPLRALQHLDHGGLPKTCTGLTTPCRTCCKLRRLPPKTSAIA